MLYFELGWDDFCEGARAAQEEAVIVFVRRLIIFRRCYTCFGSTSGFFVLVVIDGNGFTFDHDDVLGVLHKVR